MWGVGVGGWGREQTNIKFTFTKHVFEYLPNTLSSLCHLSGTQKRVGKANRILRE